MEPPRFDPTHSIKFDLGRGQVSLEGSSERLVVPADALRVLLESASQPNLLDFGHRLGIEAGRRLQERVGGALSSASVEAILDHLGGELALMGLGSLGAERWGALLVLSVSHSPLGETGDILLAAVLESALQRGFGRDVSLVRLQRFEHAARFLALGRAAAERARSLMDQGGSWTDIVLRLEKRARGEA